MSALILAGGSGTRLGGEPKALLQAGGETLLERVVNHARRHAEEVVVGLPQELVPTGEDILGGGALVIAGGETRQATFLEALDRSSGDIVVIHDVARPFSSGALWRAVIEGAKAHGAAAPALSVPARDSLAMRDGDWLGASVDREALVAIQTPYAFQRSVLTRAVSTAQAEGWISNSVTTLAVMSGERVWLVPGEIENTKVTFPDDWDEARRRLSRA